MFTQVIGLDTVMLTTPARSCADAVAPTQPHATASDRNFANGHTEEDRRQEEGLNRKRSLDRGVFRRVATVGGSYVPQDGCRS